MANNLPKFVQKIHAEIEEWQTKMDVLHISMNKTLVSLEIEMCLEIAPVERFLELLRHKQLITHAYKTIKQHIRYLSDIPKFYVEIFKLDQFPSELIDIMVAYLKK
jgi:hypothetical protein